MRALSAAIFITIALGLTSSIHYYFWARLVRDTALGQPWATLLTVAIALLGTSIPLGMLLRFQTDSPPRALLAVAYLWMGGMFLLLVGLGAGDLARGIYKVAHRLITDQGLEPGRRLALARLVGGVAGMLALGEGTVGFLATRKRTAVKEVVIRLPRLDPRLAGTTLVAISDVHLGDELGREFLSQVVETINGLKPDLVAVVGDLVDGSVKELRETAAPLANLSSRLGTFFVTGNHDYYSGAVDWISELERLGVRTLRNERVTLGGSAGGSFDLAGVEDPTGHSYGTPPDIAKALQNRDLAHPVILLSHQPKLFPEAVRNGVDLQISGHTHGGQIWPFGYLVKLQQGFLAGLIRRGASQLYVSCGTGYWGPPMRVGAPAEITRIILQPEGSA
jgi:predicted MPP superfamily phosphohydrolase